MMDGRGGMMDGLTDDEISLIESFGVYRRVQRTSDITKYWKLHLFYFFINL